MATTNKGLNQPLSNSTNWEVPLNANFGYIDAALGSTTEKSVTGISAPVVLTGAEYRSLILRFTGTLSANVAYYIPAGVGGQWQVINATTGAYTLTIASVGGGSSVSVSQGENFTVFSDGSGLYTSRSLAPTIPSGLISLWSGSVASIPTGWLLCDGTSGTPNLRDRFVVGAGGAYAVGATGGADTVALAEANMPAHVHWFDATTGGAGAHTHDLKVGDGYQGGGIYLDQGAENGGYYSSGFTAGVGDHTHAISGTTSYAGSGTAHENRPPYYALAYIMKS